MAIVPGPKRKIAAENRHAAAACGKGRKAAEGNAASSAPGDEAKEPGADEGVKNCGIPAAAAACSPSGDHETKKRDEGAPAAADCSTAGGHETKKRDGGADAAGSASGGINGVEATAAGSASVGLKKSHKGVPAASAALSGSKKGEERREEDSSASSTPAEESKESAAETGEVVEGNGKKTADEARVRNSWASFVWKIILRPSVQQQREQEATELLRENTSVLSHLFQCCGLMTLIFGEDSEVPHVNGKRTPICQAKAHYNIKDKNVMVKLSKFYSSFRAVRGDGECFYRSFIYSYLEHVLERDDTYEEDRLHCAIEKVTSAYMCLKWSSDGFYQHCNKYIQRVDTKSKKLENRTKSGQRDATFDILQRLSRVGTYASAAWICSHSEFSQFHPTAEGTTLEEYCRSQIIQRRSFADHLAIVALATLLGIRIRVFSLSSGQDQDIADFDEATVIPAITLLYTGIHYDILYQR
ncbi:hypothetical protein ACP70R_004089 [Stipagrostis hirtigluma subsp. patula]